MSFLDKLKAVFIVPEGNKGNGKKREAGRAVPAPSSRELSEAERQAALSEDSQSMFLQMLSDALEQQNEPGFDYLEYRKALRSVQALGNLDEAGCYRTAFAAAQALNVTAPKLIDAARRYVGILELEFQKFEQTAQQFLEAETTKNERLAEQLRRSIQEKEKAIETLQKELDEAKLQLSGSEGELDSAKAKVEVNKRGFSHVYQQLSGQIQADIQNMERYLS
ncbi:MAG: hypothetical protein IT266_01145 [Saprospiraceae bacterium]|nr:hypothetical protein [Saprospiraceae bacterium]